MPVIELENLRKDYGGATVMEGLDLTMEDGEFTVLVGPSGCGKSTTLRMIAGLEDVTDGRILIGGRDVTDLDPKERDLAMVFQDYALYPHMNVARNMSFALRLQRMDKAEIDRRVRDVAEVLGLTDYLGRKPAALSGGQRQRVAMGRALVRDASTFLFDEPLSNLDAKLRGQMRAELAETRQRVEKNMIYVTHDQVEAMTLGDRIVVMRAGRIMQVGTPEELFRRPRNLFVAGFIGSPPMNFLPGRIEEGRVVGEGFALPLGPGRAGGAAPSGAVTVGLRPSAFRRAADGDIPFRVEISEYLGATSVLVGRLGTARVQVEVDTPAPVRVGETLQLGVDPDQLHLFDPQTEAAL
ncbi:carbohydrate ABC transporter ATP-binding protein (CUT1 family) [Hasllibacter halocynthiae]|uniref:Carbohydrate ABC transporter ATP-binding protein (CUT1 family) n=1 Tax=Hasllibacter halocynthiae TaxID=595589 RepID=A0A2T0X2G3_9RHOB|nr:ABC transporter ATP-binding protein [Hasllibacter halocynthiae]PRY93097.1 carbohydrate ABC transporter ATP-binding protein (CUT1 family) [Hasllibacter halocynthiae]